MRIGVDIVQVERFEKWIVNEHFFEKYFTDNEKEYILSKSHPAETMAGLFASKEACLKAIGIGIGRGVDLRDIEISHDGLGRPYIVETEKLDKKLKELGLTSVDISISHTSETSIATCILF